MCFQYYSNFSKAMAKSLLVFKMNRNKCNQTLTNFSTGYLLAKQSRLQLANFGYSFFVFNAYLIIFIFTCG